MTLGKSLLSEGILVKEIQLASAYERFPFADQSTRNLLDFRPRWFLD